MKYEELICGYNALAPRQKQVMDLICKGFTDQEIAKCLGIKLSSAKTHYENICKIYNVSTSARRVRLVLKRLQEKGFEI